VSRSKIIAANQLKPPYELKPGTLLAVPAGAPQRPNEAAQSKRAADPGRAETPPPRAGRLDRLGRSVHRPRYPRLMTVATQATCKLRGLARWDGQKQQPPLTAVPGSTARSPASSWPRFGPRRFRTRQLRRNFFVRADICSGCRKQRRYMPASSPAMLRRSLRTPRAPSKAIVYMRHCDGGATVRGRCAYRYVDIEEATAGRIAAGSQNRLAGETRPRRQEEAWRAGARTQQNSAGREQTRGGGRTPAIHMRVHHLIESEHWPGPIQPALGSAVMIPLSRASVDVRVRKARARRRHAFPVSPCLPMH
jgi:hypothetical protein